MTTNQSYPLHVKTNLTETYSQFIDILPGIMAGAVEPAFLDDGTLSYGHIYFPRLNSRQQTLSLLARKDNFKIS